LPELLGYGDGVTTTFALGYENYIPGSLQVYTAPTPPAGSSPIFTALPATSPTLLATTSAAAINAGVSTVTPDDMTNIAVGSFLLVDILSLGNPEVIQVAATTPTTFTAAFAYSHLPGTSIVGDPPYSVGSPNPGVNGTNASAQILTFNTAPAAGTIVGARYQATAFSDADLAAFLARAVAWNGTGDDGLTLKRVQADIIGVVLMDQRRLTILGQGDYHNNPQAFVTGLQALLKQLYIDLTGYPEAGGSTPQLLIGAQRTRMYTPRR
jgi:hypothetical protein